MVTWIGFPVPQVLFSPREIQARDHIDKDVWARGWLSKRGRNDTYVGTGVDDGGTWNSSVVMVEDLDAPLEATLSRDVRDEGLKR